MTHGDRDERHPGRGDAALAPPESDSAAHTAVTTGRGRRARRGHRRRGVSARVRIVGWSILLVAVALATSVFISGRVLLVRADNRLAAEIIHEGTKFRAYAAGAVDPRTGQPFTSVGELLSGFLRHNLPDHNETFFSVVDGAPARRSPQTPLARLDTVPAVVDFATHATVPTTRTFETPAGPAKVAAFPVVMPSDPTSAALVVVEFAGPDRANAWSIIRILAVIGAIALAVAGLVAYLIAGRVLRPIRQVRQTAEHITESDLSGRIEVVGHDDVAHLARTFNGMLDRLESAFAAQRDFLNDAGHELRTPLTIVRGHLELLGDDPHERAQTIPLLLDEIDRMRRLVDDLVTLAQADRPDFLQPASTDIADVVVDVIAKASALAPRHWQIDAVEEAHLVVDGQRLTQALMQLCTNAVAHTDQEDTIAAGMRVTATRVQLWVRDTGSGIAPDDATRIFHRAVQGSDAVPGKGSGLGLAIVSSIARAHRGSVLLDSAPGKGATFTLDLPRHLSDASNERGGPGHADSIDARHDDTNGAMHP